jgi:SAM-dependent methyltransferase
MAYITTINNNTKKAWDINWQPHSIERLMEIFTYPRVKKQLVLYEKYLPKNERILEGGCGLGPYLIYLNRKGYNITGIDYNEEPLKKIKEYDNSLNVEVMDVKNLSFADISFGGYLSLGVIEHFPEGPGRAIEEANRILKIGGIFIVQVPIMNIFLMMRYPLELLKRNKLIRKILGKGEKTYYWQQYFKARRLKELFMERGFEIIEIIPMDHEHNIISSFGFFRDKKSYDGANKKGLAFSRFCERYLRWLTAANMVFVCKKTKHI